MTCREATTLLPLFVDGELDPRQMRALALHSSRCASCETELRAVERLQEAVNDLITTRVDALDLSSFWSSIEPRLGRLRVPRTERFRLWWEERREAWAVRIPALAAAAVIAAIAFGLWWRQPQLSTQPGAPVVAAVDNAAMIDSLDTDMDSVAVFSDPETRTTVLWVSDEIVLGDLP